MINLDKTKQQKIHNRKIDTVIYEGESDTIIVEGSLQDKRFCNSYLFSGEIRPPYTVHHMIIRMELQLPDLNILDIEVEMPSVPHEFCRDIRECLEPLKGMRIASGFTSKVKKLVDRKKACTHLLTLVTAMAPAAFQGAWSAKIRKPLDPKIYVGMMGKLENTCWAWREEGPLVEKIKTGT
ncbi:hypothetical protein DSCA_19080 [Desulfosarcina alkanivorans]|uniref:DUF2889 domain-containing protein n=1 Tax=Desulfosarcina alkanivorans TaxID=571177 RepID=A0A5K7YFY7_9BACT|nr:DUF2889 domain-containing protein [Desulfosarcina alkanivorans]BBO67978.1 hypothetical protein DSCA_19080 [Desulfosarcina alkanivorans]